MVPTRLKQHTPERCCYKRFNIDTYYCFYTTKNQWNKRIKTFPLKCWKDVGMTVPKSRETSAVYMQQERPMRAVYMQQDRGWGHATIITCVTPPYIYCIMGLRMLLFSLAFLAAYILHLFLYFLALLSLHLFNIFFYSLVSLVFRCIE